ncbi:hypothetical protein N2603_11910 [Bradyrhizobium huanghuaihaiense]|uniref:hypothetical protein n=1 Tax=Bradyrhizobium huanghuaihaiense TaxID=990078 RepID=UPI0021AA723C|nr:hypothetical protein [Bradyrhizobium sp. CB3035]UWU79128.1 hypothetical protein N2603_11910 [Bradyrhizobium sp. CB3035]
MRVSSAKMLGAVRLTEAADGIGIALFGFSNSNETYVAETDYELRITDFVPVRPDEYPIDYSITREAQAAPVQIGDACPIPYWIDNKPGLLRGSVSLSEFDEHFGEASSTEGVIAELREIISRSRTRHYQKQRHLDAEKQVLKDFEDIFSDYPVHSRYWISRFRAAVLNAIQLDDEQQASMRTRLRHRILEWVERFRYKSQLRLLSTALSSAQPHILDRLEVQLILFDYLAQRFDKRDIAALRRPDVRDVILEYFPKGLHGFITEDKPEILRMLGERSAEFAYDTLWVGSRVNLVLRFLQMFPESETGDFRDVIVTSSVIFGSSELPAEVYDRVDAAYTVQLFQLRDEIGYAYRVIFRDRAQAELWADTAEDLLRKISDLYGLLRLREGVYRLSGKIPVSERPISDRVVNELRAYATTPSKAK